MKLGTHCKDLKPMGNLVTNDSVMMFALASQITISCLPCFIPVEHNIKCKVKALVVVVDKR